MMDRRMVEGQALLPCPFCGGSGRLFSVSFPLHADVADIQVSCSQCDIIGPSVMYEYGVHTEDDLPDLEAEAITAWNTRADTDAIQAAYNAGRIEGEREAVPEGMVLVPREPTEAMLAAAGPGWTPTMQALWPKIVSDIWSAMIATTPPTPGEPA